MKIQATCMQCINLQKKINDSKNTEALDTPKWISLQINDKNIYPFTCKNGHANVFVHQGEKFELLFESAIFAMADGYFKEAVSSIVSSIERVYEYSIRIISLENKVTHEEIKSSWNDMKKQSERQLGAFIFSYLLTFKKKPPLLTTKQSEFRNDTIHKGYFPTYEEVLEFGEAGLKIIYEVLTSLKQQCKEGIKEYQAFKSIDMFKKAKEISENPMTLSTGTLIKFGTADNEFSNGMTLSTYLTNFKKQDNR